MAWTPTGIDALDVRFWVKNLTDHPVIASTTITNLYDSIDYIPPRQVGVEVSYRF